MQRLRRLHRTVRLLLAAALALLAGVCTYAAESRMVPVAKPRKRPAKNVLLVVDTSGSMTLEQSAPLAKALAVVRSLAGQPVDEMNLAVIGFTARPTRWVYRATPKAKGKRWVPLPDADAVKACASWLRGQTDTYGATAMAPALELALRERRKQLLIVVVSDGDLCMFGGSPRFWSRVEQLQAWRAKKKLDCAIVATVCVGDVANVGTGTVMRRLGREGGGGAWYVQASK